MRYLSVCSGIEAASVAWRPLGWESVAFSEIEPFPCAVLSHHYPQVPNRGDMTKFKDWPDADFDLLVGGTPCQSFSVAGLRKGLDDPRGSLMLTYLALADRYRPRWLVWENVPGVLSADEGRAFGSLLGGLAILGYGFAYRVLDAQYFGLAQRRARVFVVGCLGDWRRAAAVLFERESLSGHPAPRREKGEVAPTVPSRSTAGGGLGTDFDCDGGLVTGTLTGGASAGGHGRFSSADAAAQGFLIPSTGDVSHCLNAGGMGRIDYEIETLIAHSLRADGFDASEDGTGRGTPLIAHPLLAKANCSHDDSKETYIAFSAKDSGADAGELAPTLRAGGHHRSHANAGVMPAIAFAENQRGELVTNDTMGSLKVGGGKPGQGYPAIAFAHQTAGNKTTSLPCESDFTPTLKPGAGSGSIAVQQRMQVRRLTPLECERLQGFPDNYTAIPYRGKVAADGPRYKALGNSMAVPVMAWIGRRIQIVDEIVTERAS